MSHFSTLHISKLQHSVEKEQVLEQEFSVLDSMCSGEKGQYFKYLISAETGKNGSKNIFLGKDNDQMRKWTTSSMAQN